MVCTSPNIIRMIKSRRKMGGACSTYGERSFVCRVWAGIHEGERNVLDDPGVNGMIILKWIFRKWDRRNGQD